MKKISLGIISFSSLLCLVSGQNIGIGTTTPAYKLEINGNLGFTTANPTIYSASYLVIPGGAYFNSGNTYFQNPAQFRGGVNNDQGTLTLTGSNGVVNSASTYFMVAGKYAIDGSDGYLRLNQQGSYPNGVYTPHRFWSDGGIVCYGNLGIGVGTPNFPLHFPNTLGDKIALWGSSGSHYGFGIQSALLQVYTDINTSNIAFGYGSSGSFTANMYVYGDGNAWLAGGLTQFSDARFKKNLKSIKNALNKLMLLSGYNYYWKDEKKDRSLQSGVLAQEVQKVMPELVKADEKGMLSVNYSGLIPLLIQSIKEQQNEIKEQRKMIQEIRKENKRMGKILAEREAKPKSI